MDLFRYRVSHFFGQYVGIEALVTKENLLKYEDMQYVTKFLLDKGVFDNKEDIKKEAIRECGVILPDFLFQ